MLKPNFTNQFEKDLALAKKRNKDIKKLKEIIGKLVAKEPLPKKYRNHRLHGKFVGRMECHIEPDWLLIYKIEVDKIFFERTGAHSDLFD